MIKKLFTSFGISFLTNLINFISLFLQKKYFVGNLFTEYSLWLIGYGILSSIVNLQLDGILLKKNLPYTLPKVINSLFVINILNSCFLILLLSFFRNYTIVIYLLTTACISFTGMSVIISNVLVREEKIIFIAFSRFIQAFLFMLLTIVFNQNLIVILMSFLLSIVLSFVFYLRSTDSFKEFFRGWELGISFSVLKNNIHYVLFALPSTFINNYAISLPMILSQNFFKSDELSRFIYLWRIFSAIIRFLQGNLTIFINQIYLKNEFLLIKHYFNIGIRLIIFLIFLIIILSLCFFLYRPSFISFDFAFYSFSSLVFLVVYTKTISFGNLFNLLNKQDKEFSFLLLFSSISMIVYFTVTQYFFLNILTMFLLFKLYWIKKLLSNY